MEKQIKKLENDLVTAKSVVSPLEIANDPAVLGAQYRLEQARHDLSEFHAEHSTKGYMEILSNNHSFNSMNKTSNTKSILSDWTGPQPTSKNEKSVWADHLGGRVDRSLCQVRLVHHQRHWDPTTNVRGLTDVGKQIVSSTSTAKRDPLHYVQEPVTMATAQRIREARKRDPLLDASPSVRHASIQFIRNLVPQRTSHHDHLEKSFKYGKLVGGTIRLPDIDHKCFGTPFATQQVVRTILDRTIDQLEEELSKYPKYGMTARQQLPKAEAEMALAEYKRVRVEMTGKRAAALERRVAAAKKRVKNKLGMMMALKSKGFGDFSFMQKIKAAEEKNCTPENSRPNSPE